jgi:hypothetical protein
MPTLDDAPTIEKLLGTTDLTAGDSTASDQVARVDVLQVYDISEQKAKTITVQELGEALGLTFS